MVIPAEPRADDADHGGIAGHPRGLTTLFFTESWERFSCYGCARWSSCPGVW